MEYHSNEDIQEESNWVRGFGLVNTHGKNVCSIGMFPNIEYVGNSCNRGIVVSWLGYGLFVGKINAAFLDEDGRE